MSYLDFTSFHQRAVKLLSGPLCIRARLECYKTEALRGDGENGKKEKEGGGGSKRRLKKDVELLLSSFFVNNDPK